VDFIEAARKLIEIDSTPDNGTRDVAQFAAELCRQAGLIVEIQGETHNGIEQANVIARPGSVRPESELLLQTHLDTSDPGSYGFWTKTGSNPFNASIYLDTMYGLGAASAKLDFLCKLKAISELPSGSRFRLPFVLVGSFGEEIGMPGAIKLIRKKKISAKMALVGEPTGLRLVNAGKGFAGVEIEIPFSDEEKDFRLRHDTGDGSTSQSRVFVGRAAHSSSPQMGESAIGKMLDYLTKLPEGLAIMEIEGGISYNTVPAHAVLEIDMVGELKESIAGKIALIAKAIAWVESRFHGLADPEFDPPEPSLNIGQIRTYEDFVKISGCCRLPPSVSDTIYEEWMQILRRECEKVGAVFRVTDYKQPFRTKLEEPLTKICQEELVKLGLSPTCTSQSVANEANVFSRFGIASVVIGPGQGVGNSHAPNERVKIDELYEAVRFYKGVLERVCL
jgi:acetylornithine deacetylase/succinyl-diaminopimelate desuccinylase-like protein